MKKRMRLWALIVALMMLAACTGAPDTTPGDDPGESSPQPSPADNNGPDGPKEHEEVFYPFNEWSGNPIIIGVYTADPSARVHPNEPDKLYLYPSRDMDPPLGCDLMNGYRVYSTTDLANWTDEGEILHSDDVPWGRPDGGFMWAPDCVYKDGKYYYYFPHPTGEGELWNSTWTIGVAVSDSPVGGFRDNEIVRLTYPNGEPIHGGGKYIDPNIFIDDCGTAYLIVGGSQECRIARLADCMTRLAEDFVILTQNNHYHNPTYVPRGNDRPAEHSEVYNAIRYFHEGPWMFTRVNDAGTKIYYLMHPGTVDDSGRGSSMVYSTADNPYGPWTFGSVILDPVGTGDTSHGSVVEFKGRWYLFYHNAALSDGIGNIRSSCAEEMFFNPDGSIQKVEQTVTGLRTLADPGSPDFGETRIRIEPQEQLNDQIVPFSVPSRPGGGDFVRTSIRVHHAPQTRNSRVKFFLNGEDLSYVNTFAGREYTEMTVTLPQGGNRLVVNVDLGGPKVQYISIKYLD
jgi:hypothetical protein